MNEKGIATPSKGTTMKKSSLKNYIALLEADAAANANARDYWMR